MLPTRTKGNIMKDTIIVDPENARVNRRALNLLEHNTDVMDDETLLSWAKALNHELECETPNYQYLIMDNDEWIIADENYLRDRWDSLRNEEDESADSVCVADILKLLAENQSNKSHFTFACEVDIRLDDCDVDERSENW